MFKLYDVLLSTISFTLRVLPIVFFGMLASEVLLGFGLLKKLEKIGKPLTKLAKLPDVCGVAFVTAIGSPTASNAMLQDLREEGLLKDREVLLSSILNSTVVPLKETFTYHLPVILPMLGLYVGGVYVATLWLGTVVLLTFVIVCGRLTLDGRSVAVEMAIDCKDFSFKLALRRTLKKFKRIGIIFVVVTFCTFTLMNVGLIDKTETILLPIAKVLNLPSIAIPAIATYIASPIVGFSMFGSLLQSGAICERDAIISLLLGSVFMLPILYIRFYFPQWISIFGLRLGLLRGLISLSLMIFTRAAVLLLFLKIY